MKLPKPYWTDGHITIYCGDCLDLIGPISKQACIDAVVTDPPYGINYRLRPHKGGWSGQKRILRPIPGDDKPFDPKPWLTFNNVLLWGANYYAGSLPPIGRWLAFDKLAGMRFKNSFADVEFAWHSIRKPCRIFSMKWKGCCCEKDGERGTTRYCPGQKPVRLMRWCFDECDLKRGDTVVDPYMGSGTTLVAARRHGLKAIGIELQNSLCKVAVERLEAEG